jgi:hypothetical protein
MSSDIIVRRCSPSSKEVSVALTTKPFQDICDRIFEAAIKQQNPQLAQIVESAKFDDYLDLHELDEESLVLIEEVIADALRDPKFFSWQADWQNDPIFIARCQEHGTTPMDESIRLREMITCELRRLGELLLELKSNNESHL